LKERIKVKKNTDSHILTPMLFLTKLRQELFELKKACPNLPEGIYIQILYDCKFDSKDAEQYIKFNANDLKKKWAFYQHDEDVFDCEICCDEFSIHEAINIGCEHLLCRTCALMRLKVKIKTGDVPNDWLISCSAPKTKCGCTYGITLIQE